MLSGDLGEPTHTLVPCWMPKPLPPRNQCMVGSPHPLCSYLQNLGWKKIVSIVIILRFTRYTILKPTLNMSMQVLATLMSLTYIGKINMKIYS